MMFVRLVIWKIFQRFPDSSYLCSKSTHDLSLESGLSPTEAYLIIERGPEGVVGPLIVHTLAIFDGD